MIRSQVAKIQDIYHEYPRQFWTLMGATFIDALGGALLFPFFTLYMTRKFDIGMTQVGLVFGVFSIAHVIGNALGGGLADKFGRKGMVIFGLVTSALTIILMGVVDTLALFAGAALIVGLFANAGGPAREAMIADLLPKEKRAQGFGMFRVVHNLAVTIGPAIGGLLAAQSYLWLFLLDALASCVTAVIVYFKLDETKPAPVEGEEVQSTWQTFRGYGRVMVDNRYLVFLLASSLVVLVFTQMNGTLAVYLRDFHGVPEQGFGYILSMNAAMVVLFQFAITRRVKGVPPYLVLAGASTLFVIGFGMYGLVSTYGLFLLAMAIITVGEMLMVPVGQSLAAAMSPDDMRGRYMAVYGFSWIVPSSVGIYLAGLIMDNMDPRWVWYAAGLVALLPTAIFLWMNRRDVIDRAAQALTTEESSESSYEKGEVAHVA